MTKTKKIIWVGIDPGKQGAIAAIDSKKVLMAVSTPVVVTRTRRPRAKTKTGKPKVTVYTDYDISEMYEIVKGIVSSKADVRVMIEKQWARMNDAKSAVFEVGRGFGIWQTIVAVCGLSLEVVSPNKWKSMYIKAGSDKKESKLVCKKIYPSFDLPLVKDEAKAEAILIADYFKKSQLTATTSG